MTGPQHYREAERWLQVAHRHTDADTQADAEIGLMAAAAAQVHATLALTAATVAQTAARGPGDVSAVWTDVTS